MSTVGLDVISIGEKNLYMEDVFMEGVAISYDPGSGFMVNLKLSGLRDSEINNFKSGKMSLDLEYLNDVIILSLEIENVYNSDLAFNINLCGLNSVDELPEKIEDGCGLPVTMILTEGRDNIVKGLRVFAMTNKFSNLLLDLMKKQYNENFDNSKYEEDVRDIFIEYPTTRDLVKESLMQMELK